MVACPTPTYCLRAHETFLLATRFGGHFQWAGRSSGFMNPIQASVVEHLLQVNEQRRQREDEPKLQAAVHALKLYQQQRFTRTYTDLLDSQRYGAAARFFLDELYGPTDFSQRDAQFMRLAPVLVRFFPTEIVQTVEILAELHAVSEALDTEMARHLLGCRVDARSYIRAWQSTGHPAQRELQVALTLQIGTALDRYTRKPLLRRTLRIMRGPARSAGLAELQRFLEAGFDAFAAMRGADEFLRTVGHRERELASAIFAAETEMAASDDHAHDAATALALALDHLP
jgi:hypothetical protein